MFNKKFTIKEFNNKYKTDEDCINEIFNNKFSESKECSSCNRSFKYHKVSNRKCYSCQFCGNQIHPLANTIFHKSETSLKLWFYAIFLFSCSKNGVSGKELQRQLGVTYKTAWRMAKQIRQLFDEESEQLNGDVEADETYVGGKMKGGKRGRGSENKTPVIGAVQRQGEVIAKVVGDTKSSTIKPFIRENVSIEANLNTDEYRSYNNLNKLGYNHKKVNHGARQWADGDTHTNTIEGFWSQLKRSIRGTYHSVSPKYLQQYVNEFSWRYNHREYKSLFGLMIKRV